ncbi:hypothetical protein CcaCcLH18_12050 [Colletotrichum camelliae]|nr:hypothetical protein CcaCcLH18_12050 [Colletotrichum camelliae]
MQLQLQKPQDALYAEQQWRKLHERQEVLFDDDAAELSFWETGRLNKFRRQEMSIPNLDALREHLNRGEKDPHVRHLFIASEDSRSPLNCSMDMLKLVGSYHQIDPSFLESVHIFGEQDDPIDCGLAHFRASDSTRCSTQDKMELRRLGRSGRAIQLSYLLRSVEYSDSGSTGVWGWQIRQAANYHSFDVETGKSFWFTVKGNDLFKKRIRDTCHLLNIPPKTEVDEGDNDTADAAQEESEGDSGPEFVLVSMPTTPDMTSLKYATSEIDAVKVGCKSRGIGYTHAAGRHKDVLIAALNSGCKVFHFAGHGDTHSIDPLQSRLLLEDWKNQSLTAGSLLEINLKEKAPFLAYLSARGTSQIRDDKSVDESIHLAGAFQLAGFRHVIGTLLEVDDALCVDTAKLTYKGLWEGGMTDDSLCQSLHHTIRHLRDNWVHSHQIRNRPQTCRSRAGEETTAQLEEDMGREALVSLDGNDLTRDIRRSEVTGPLWVPYVNFGP